MKLQKLLLGIALFVPFLTFADEQTPTPTEPKNGVNVIIFPKRPISQRPKAPSNQYVVATLADGCLTLQFSIDEGTASMTLSNEAEVVESQIQFETSSPFIFYVGEISSLSIEIDTEYGNHYSGTLSLN